MAVLLSRPLTMQDLPHLRYALTQQQALLERAFLLVGQREELVQALEAENQALRRALDGEGKPWDDPDEQPW